VPALAARIVDVRNPLRFAYVFGLIGYVLGLLASDILDFPTGAAIVCTLAAMAAVTLIARASKRVAV